MRLLGNMEVRGNELYIGGVSALDLAKEYGTPLYVMDEELIRDNCRKYYRGFRLDKGVNKVAYAGKAFLTLAMCQIINEEGLSLDVVSGGELYTAYKSGFPMEKVVFHGNNKTIEEIEMGIKFGVGRFVVDNFYEMDKINEIAKKYGKTQKILLRMTPGIEAHTHEYIKTGQIDSKFGFTILNDNAIEVVKRATDMESIELMGFHCHIGSQIFEIEPYKDAVKVMLSLIQEVKEKLGFEMKELDLGGGFGIYYEGSDSPKEFEDFCEAILEETEKTCRDLNIAVPALIIEPGRSIVGNAGTTLYTIGSIKEIPNVRKYVAVDGGMTDNIRPALYQAHYECMIANKADLEPCDKVTIAGKCCESGDILITDAMVPEPESGDILAVPTTGAYGYSMSSNYNKIPRPAVVLVKDGSSKLMCKRESYEDLLKNELEL